MTVGTVVTGVVSAVLVLIGTWISARFSRKTGEEANNTADWSQYGERMDQLLKQHQVWTTTQLAERDKRIDGLESRLDTIEAKYRQAIAYIRRLVRQLQRHVDPDDIEAPPDEILPDL